MSLQSPLVTQYRQDLHSQKERASKGEFSAETGIGSRLRAANSSTALICSRVISNCSMISSILAPASRFSNTEETGIRVSRNTHAPLSLPGTRSTAGHCDQSSAAMTSLSSAAPLLYQIECTQDLP